MTSIINRPIQNLKADDLNKELEKLPNEKKMVRGKEEYRFSQSYLNKIYRLMKETMHYAVIKEILPKDLDPFEVEGKVHTQKSNKPKKEVKPPTRAECIKFLNQLFIKEEENQETDIIKIQLFAGPRIGETLALSTEDIDLEEEKIYIRTSLTKDENNRTVRRR